MRRIVIGTAAAAVALNAWLLPAEAGSPIKKVNVGDDYYGPTKLTVRPGTTVKWVWQAGNVNSHDVKLKKGPAGAKKFHSPSASSQFTFKQTLKVPGTYSIICTVHTSMTMKIVVKK